MSTLDNIVFSSPKSIFVLYLIISGNFLANLFGCRTQEALNNNMLLKHFLGFMTMFFFVVLVDSNSKWSDSPSTQLLFTLMFYCMFVFTTRMDFKWWIAFILALSVIYILQVYKDHSKTEEKDRKEYEKYQRILIYITGFIILLGFLVYSGRKKAEYGENFNFLTFLLGKTNCSFNKEPVELNDYQAFMKIFS
jgi:phosphatidylglycerophosphate synthase